MEALGAYDSFAGPEAGERNEEPSGDSTDDFVSLATDDRGWVGTGAVIASLLTLAASLVGLLNLVRAEAVTGGALLPVSAAAADIWQNASGWWIGLGAGLPGHGDPFDFVLWILALLGGGNANAALVWLLLLAMPLSGLAAWFAAAALTSRRRFRFVAALAWAGAPALQVALNQGRLGALIAHLMIPLLVLALLRATGSAAGHGRYEAASGAVPAGTASGRVPSQAALPDKPGVNGTPSWTAAAAAGLALAVVVASAPILALPAVLVIVGSGVVLGYRGRTVWWALLPGAAIFGPFAVSTLDHPRALLGDPGLPLGFDAAPLWQQLLGQPLRFDSDGGLAGLGLFGPGDVPWALMLALLVGAPPLVLAVAALFVPGKRTQLTRFLWVAALLVLALDWLASHVATGVNAGILVGPYTGPAVSAAGFAILGAALLGAEQLLAFADNATALPTWRSYLLKTASAAVAIVLVAGPLAGIAAWSAGNLLPLQPTASRSDALPLGSARLVQTGTVRTVPATAADHAQGPEQTRTLLITAGENGTFTSALVRGAGTTLDALSTIASARGILGTPGQERLAADDPASASIRNVVATIAAGDGVDPRVELEQLGVGFVVLADSDSAAQLTASRIDAVPGLVAVGQTDSGWLWRVTPLAPAADPTADASPRARIIDTSGKVVGTLDSEPTSVVAQVPEGAEGRLVVLAERSDPGWSAWLNGRKLTATTSGWSQAFTLPPGGGELEIRYSSPWFPWLGILQIVIIGLTVVLAIPMRAPRPKSGVSKDENSLRKEYSNA
jgi:hypothetical protein